MALPLTHLDRDARRIAKVQVVAGMNSGLSWRQAAAAAGVTLSEATAHRLRRLVRLHGESGLDDRRGGTAYKLSSVIREWLVTYCSDHPHTPSRVLQTVLVEQHAVHVSLGYLNQIRAALQIRYQPPPRQKKP